ncbi:MAG: hypothetical protein D6B28_01580 [Gammaproteobacteria bacterium]|nr:MAG: hypothetical protein D6B28_01580 [Gammaproteobacteria bacterium]
MIFFHKMIFFLLFFASYSCERWSVDRTEPKEIFSAIGIYLTNSKDKTYLDIKPNSRYFLCDKHECFEGKYEFKNQQKTFLVLYDFYNNRIGLRLAVEARPTHPGKDIYRHLEVLFKDSFNQPFDVSGCFKGKECVGIGEKKRGIKFTKK